MSGQPYIETFDDGPGGWYGWISNSEGPKALGHRQGAVISSSPWWVDYNHAPPGAGYLHMVFCLDTVGPQSEHQKETAGVNRYMAGGFGTDLRHARLTVRLAGELEDRGARLVVLVQGFFNRCSTGWLLHAQGLEVGPDWAQQTVVLDPDPHQWTCLGSRHDRTDTYAAVDLEPILSDVNANIMLILFPLEIAPMGPIACDRHRLRAGKDYPLWRSRLPEGYIMMDQVRIDMA